MNNIIRRKWNQNTMVTIEDLRGFLFQAEENGHTFEISGIDGTGAEVALSGTPSGVLLREDGQDVTLTCSVSEGVVRATLPAGAYAVPGRFGLTIFLTSDSQTMAIYAAVGTVGKTSSGQVAPPAAADITTLINQINAAIAAIPVNYNANFAPAYSTSGLYAVGQYVTYNGNLYRCTTAITSGESWTAAHWTQVSLGGEVSGLKNTIEFIDGVKIVQFQKGYYINTSGSTTTLSPASSSSGMMCASVNCQPGDVFTIKGTGGSSGRLWAFVNTNNNNSILDKAASNATLDGGIVTAPENATKAVFNGTSDGITVIKGYTADKRIKDDENDLFDIKQNVYDTPSVLLGFDKDHYMNSSGAYVSNTTYPYAYGEEKFIEFEKNMAVSMGNSAYSYRMYFYTASGTSYYIGRTDYISGEKRTILNGVYNGTEYKYVRFVIKKADNTYSDAIFEACCSAFHIYKDGDEEKTKDIRNITGNKPIEYTYGRYYNLRDSDTIDLTSPRINNEWKTAVVPCSAGDVFTISGHGKLAAQLYAFLDDEYNVIKRYGAHEYTIKGLELTAPEDAAYLILNDCDDLQSYYGVLNIATTERTDETVDGILANTQPIDWSELPQPESGGFVLGWIAGSWSSTNSQSTSDNEGSIRFWTYLKKERGYIQRNYIEIDIPSGTYMRIREFASTSSSEQISTTLIKGKAIFRMNDNSIYRITLSGLWDHSPTDYYLNETFINKIKIRPILINGGKKAKSGTYEFFTVDVERPLPFNDENYTTETQTVECVLRLPSSYKKDGVPTRLVFMAHGGHGYIQASTNTWYNASWKTLCDYLLDAGYALFDANVLEDGTTDRIGYANGSPLYVNVVKRAYDYIQENYNVYPQIFCHGVSMGGTGASAFVHAYPELVIAQSSFAGRDIVNYLWKLSPLNTGSFTDEDFAIVYGYESLADLNSDKFSHMAGNSPSLTLKKLNNDGTITISPDRETAYSDWLSFFGELSHFGKNEDAGVWIGERKVPYKAWNAWNDNEGYTKLELILQKAFNVGNACPYYVVNYENTGEGHNDPHADICFGKVYDMKKQLVSWFKRWE